MLPNNICNMCGQDLHMSALTLGHCVPLGSCIHIKQILPTQGIYTTYVPYSVKL